MKKLFAALMFAAPLFAALMFAVLSLAAATLSAQTAAKPAAAASSDTVSDKVLLIELTIPAPLPTVWQAFTTSEGLSTWLAPNSIVDLRPGGEWMVHFPGGSTGGGTILSFVPQRELVISALAPDKFPNVRRQRTTAKFSFAARGNTTLVRLTQTGWKNGEEWNSAYEYLAAGNAQLLATLHHRFVSGPIDWTK
jgi:uncharacterized protein YndB with AHSA1/START domain